MDFLTEIKWEKAWELIKGFFDSNFFTAFFGASIGALGAGYISKKQKQKDDLLNEIRSTNKAIVAVFGICNPLLGMKKQHIKPLKEDFDASRRRLDHFMEQRKKEIIPISARFDFKANFETYHLPDVPIANLLTLMFEKLSVAGKALHLGTTLNQTLQTLRQILKTREEFIVQHKNPRHPIAAELYFGLPTAVGTDNTYPSCVEAIYNLTDDSLYFAISLSEELVTHGNELATTYKKLFKEEAPTVHQQDFSDPECQALLPDPKLYEDWQKMYRKKPNQSLNWWKRMRAWSKKKFVRFIDG